MSALDVALDLPQTRHISIGMGKYARELTARLPRVAPDLTFAIFPHDRSFGWDEQVRLPLQMRFARPRLAHFLSVYAPLFAPRPYVVTIHDLIHLRFPEQFKISVGPYYRTIVRAVCANARHVITDDERTVRDLHRFLGVPPEKVAVVPLGVDDEFLRDGGRVATPRPFFLCAGNHRAHKDLPTLFAAWEALEDTIEADLLLTGSDDLPAAAARPRRARGELRFLGDLSSAELAAYYRGALALVHPALAEGFGLPMLEAAACGARVIACADAVPMIFARYARTFAPRDVRALARLLAEAAAEPAGSPEGQEFARTLTWSACAERTAQVYRALLAEGSAG